MVKMKLLLLSFLVSASILIVLVSKNAEPEFHLSRFSVPTPSLLLSFIAHPAFCCEVFFHREKNFMGLTMACITAIFFVYVFLSIWFDSNEILFRRIVQNFLMGLVLNLVNFFVLQAISI